jgi:hypothetical protein
MKRGVSAMSMWKMKGCARCGGDMLIEKDQFHGWYEKCFQCSFSRDLPELAQFKKKSDLPKAKPISV